MAKIDIGSLIDIGNAVKAGLDKAADNKNVPMTQDDADKAKPVVTKEVQSQLKDQIATAQDVVDNQTNEEPVWKSRVLRGAVVALVGAVWAIYNQYADTGTIHFDDLYAQGIIIAGAAYTIYGRLTGAGTPSI